MKSYLRPLQRNINCVADVMVLLAGSERFLQLVQVRGVEDLGHNEQLAIKLGWFETKSGETRWGIELVEEYDPDGVRWMQEPNAEPS
jgi:hypothetical protein